MKYSIPTKIVGVSFKNSDGIERQDLIKRLKEGDVLTIEREPDNKYDKNSHIIKSKDGVLGHVSKSLAEDLVEKVDEGGEKIIGIKEYKVTGQAQHTFGVNIIIELDKKDDWNQDTKIETE